jgi:glutamate N-acetyltransferase/amino-acid N-acetyltransferase
MIKNITNVRGIKCWGAHTGVKSMRRDLAIIYSEKEASAAAVFTQNEVVAECIKLSKKHIENGRAHAIVVNAGNANACTGPEGYAGAEAMARVLSEELGIDADSVLVASTGLIGKKFPTEDIVSGIKENVRKLSSKSNAGSFTANAILTTDTFAKEGFLEFDCDGYEVNMGGIAKGSGMIHPNMATMLAFIITDAAVAPELLQKTLTELTEDSFNMITVDGDTSTNDMVAIMANGLAGNDLIQKKSDPGYKEFRTKLLEMMVHLARQIVSDGEGASKFVEYHVTGSKTSQQARIIARAISDSTLVKTAMFGRDPNWGRIVAAAGNAGAGFDYTKADVALGDEERQVTVLENGVPKDYDRNFMKKLLRNTHLVVKLNMNEGENEATAWGSDMTTDYVLFNSVYTT